MRPTFRKLLFTAILLTILLHEPTFKLVIAILVNVHIFARIAFDASRNFANAYFPAAASWAVNTLHDAQVFFLVHFQKLVSMLKPTLQFVTVKIVGWATTWLRENPRWLCEVNAWISGVGKGMAAKASRDGNDEVLEEWLVAGEEVANFCAGVRGDVGLIHG
jgi:hypothetical protein